MQAQKDNARLAKQSWWVQGYLYSDTAINSLEDGAMQVAKALPKGIVHLFKDMATTQQLDDEGEAASIKGDTKTLQQVDNKMTQLGDEEYKPITDGFQLLHLIYSDPKTRTLLENFVKQYVNSESYLAMTQQVAHSVGEIGTAVAIALVTKRPSTFAPEVASSEAFTSATTSLDKIEETLTELEKCHEAEGLSMDTEQVLVKEEAYHVTQSANLARSILNGIDEKYMSIGKNRFGKAFYVAEEPDTAISEVSYHGGNISHGIRFKFLRESTSILDLTDKEIANKWNYTGGNVTKKMQDIGPLAKKKGYDVIRFYSERTRGNNLAVLNRFNEILKPQGISKVTR